MTAPLRITRQQAAAETKIYAVTRDQIKHAAATLRVVTKKDEPTPSPLDTWMQ